MTDITASYRIGHDLDQWDVRILRRAYGLAARKSDDPRTQNAAVLIDRYGSLLCEAANCFPEGINATPERLAGKYRYMVHAERAVIYEAARLGVRTKGAVMYCPWFACTDCAQAIIQAGIATVIGHRECMGRTSQRWFGDIVAGDVLLDEAGVKRLYVEGPIGECKIMFDGQEWEP